MWRLQLIRKPWRCFSTSAGVPRWFDSVGPAAKDPIQAVTEAFNSDPFPQKINLGLGAYRDEQGKPLVLQCVQQAEEKIRGCNLLDSVSASVASSALVEECIKLVYGRNVNVVKEKRFAGVPALSGTGACRLFAEFQRNFFPESAIYLPDPTWTNHHNIWANAHVPVRTFHYYHPHLRGLDFAALIDDVKNAPDGSFFLLHPCAHNPTGIDLTEDQWSEISNLFKMKNHFPFFDMAYQGLATGDVDKDASSIRIFLEDGHLIGCAQSFTKTMGLFGHRTGCLSLLCADRDQAVQVKSQLQQIAGAMYGSPPVHGIVLLSTILGDQALKSMWFKEVKAMASRIQSMRAKLRERLELTGSSLNWEHITKQVGMFWFSGLTPEQVDRLAKEFHVYMTPDGRMSMAGVTTSNVRYLANAVHEVTKCS
ncbi:unnamed protein product [Linum trigynum]|uniref:aspartate transaminase n=1 Tax=Linum trigynum TaxID=586398 RepID=A0AAV2DYK3_9ROSI